MLTAQAHTLDGLFAKLTSDALACPDMERLERYMKLALKAQNQARATLQTLVELKAPKKIAFFSKPTLETRYRLIMKSNARARGKIGKRQTNYWGQIMANGWTPERRAKQAELIQQWQPWKRSTGPTSGDGKAKVSRNAWKGGVRPQLRELAKVLREVEQQRQGLL